MRLIIRIIFALVLVIFIAEVPAFGQEKGTFELGAFGKAAFFDRTLNYSTALGVGARGGYYLFRNLMLEADLAIATPDDLPLGEANYLPIHARLIYALPLSQTVSLLLGGGYTHNKWAKGLSGSEDGAGGLVGLRWNLFKNWGVRIDGIGDNLPVPTNGATNNADYGIQVGISFMLSPGGPKDNDGDGVLDDVDACPDTPLLRKVDVRGCPLPVPVESDGDADGVIDQKDNCPDTPKGVEIDARGCPLPVPVESDGDGDGVVDQNDSCPDTPKGVKIDARGCPSIVILEGVKFSTNSTELTSGAMAVLDRVAESLVANPNMQVEISGHTDNTSSREYNLRLSLWRAERARNYLISRGVLPENVKAKGYGPDQPVASNDTPKGRAQNRRVEMRRLN